LSKFAGQIEVKVEYRFNKWFLLNLNLNLAKRNLNLKNMWEDYSANTTRRNVRCQKMVKDTYML